MAKLDFAWWCFVLAGAGSLMLLGFMLGYEYCRRQWNALDAKMDGP